MRLSMSISAATRALPLLFCLLTGCRKEPADGVALVGATLIDGTGGPALPNAVVVVRRGRIETTLAATLFADSAAFSGWGDGGHGFS